MFGEVDSLLSLYRISDAFDKYKNAVGGTLDEATGLLEITEEQYAKLQSMFFKIGHVSTS